MNFMRDDIQSRTLRFSGALLIAAACALTTFAARADEAAPQSASGAPAALAVRDDAGPAAPRTELRDEVDDDDDDDDLPQPPAPPPPPPPRRHLRRRPVPVRPVVYSPHDAREGAIFSLGVGGAQQYVSGAGHSGAFDTDLRLGYGFSDRFQLFFDLDGTEPPQDSYQALSMWHLRLHGQTVLVGDRRGNGLNLNVGIGLGGVSTQGYQNVHDSSQVGVSVGGGLSYEARLSPHFALAPEIFATWQQVPNNNNLPSDIAWQYGLRLNIVWYSAF